MDIIYEGIRTIAVYLILVTVLLNLVNGNTYKKYVELVCGMVLILIVFSPITKVLSLDDNVQYNLNLSNFKLEMLEQEFFIEAEKFNQEALAKEYKKVLLEQVNQIVEQEGRIVEQSDITLSKEDYGVVEEVIVEIREERNENEEENEKIDNQVIEEEILVEEVFISINEEKENNFNSFEKNMEENYVLEEENQKEEKKEEQENQENKEKNEIIKEKNRITEQIRQKLATAFAIKEEQIVVYEKGE